MRFGGVEALSDLSVDIPEGAVFGLIGPNGSGKTTLFNVVTGLHAPTAGRVMLGARNIAGMKPHAIVRLGVSRTFQNLRIYERMTVFENVWAAQHGMPDVRLTDLLFSRGGEEDRRREAVDRLLELTDLGSRRDDLAKSLPLPEQRRLELARALARSPEVLLLDEPAGGMTPTETAGMANLIGEVASLGRTCVVIEHKMDMIESVCERVCVLNFGRKIAEGAPRSVLEHPEVLEAYLGRDE